MPSLTRRLLGWSFALAVIPLLVSSLGKDDTEERIASTLVRIEQDPDLKARVEGVQTMDALLAALPEHKIDGALLSNTTWAHWLYALLAAAAFWCLIRLIYPIGNTTSTKMWAVGLFTGTIGILLLLGIQYAAMYSQGLWLGGSNILVLIFYVIKFIGFSYRSALDPSNGFILSFFGFTFGVGLCEELCKSLPLIFHYRRNSGGASMDLRAAVMWGLATGIGFGVSEGITYSSDYYKGVYTGGIYVVRFVSCVALHAVWSASTAILLWRRQEDIQGVEAWYGWAAPVLKLLAISMVLHGLYDTLLKRNMGVGALVVAVLSFAWFFALYEWGHRQEQKLSTAVEVA